MAIVANSSPLILYAKIGRLDLLHALFGRVLIPPAVRREVVVQGLDRPGIWQTLSALPHGQRASLKRL